MKSAEMPRSLGERDPVFEPESATRTARVLLAEDDDSMRALLTEAFESRGYEVTPCADGLCLVGRLGALSLEDPLGSYDVIVSDIRLPGVTGLEVLDGLAEEPGRPPFVLITAFGDAATHEEAERLGAAALLDKPFEIDQLMGVVEEVVEDRRSAHG